jgi:hypothetical protein
LHWYYIVIELQYWSPGIVLVFYWLKKASIVHPCHVRSILMRIIYDMKYDIINKGFRNNIFILNGIIYDVLKSNKMHPVQLQIYDYQQMFDALDLKQALSDLYDVGVNDDTLGLLHQANQEIQMAVKTQNVLTERQTVKDIVL